LPNDELVGEDPLAVKVEVALKVRALEEERKPEPVVGPHFLVGNLVERGPERHCLLSFAGLPEKIVGKKNRAVQTKAVAKLEMEFAALLGPQGHDVELLEGFAEGGVERGLTGIDLPARAVNFARAETAFFANEKNFSISNNEKKIGPDTRLPGCPVDHVAR